MSPPSYYSWSAFLLATIFPSSLPFQRPPQSLCKSLTDGNPGFRDRTTGGSLWPASPQFWATITRQTREKSQLTGTRSRACRSAGSERRWLCPLLCRGMRRGAHFPVAPRPVFRPLASFLWKEASLNSHPHPLRHLPCTGEP